MNIKTISINIYGKVKLSVVKKIFIMPAAGEGIRFKNQGFSIPKPLIKVNKSVMFLEAAKTFGFKKEWIFILRLNKYKEKFRYNIKKKIKNYKIFYLKKKTRGQADTIFKINDFIKSNLVNIFIISCDLFFKFNKDELRLKIKNFDLIVFVAKPTKINLKNINNYGWVKISNSRIVKSACKTKASNNPKNDWVIIGSFIFKNKIVFNLILKKLFSDKLKIHNEYYLDSAIQIALSLGLKVSYIKVTDYKSWGTPNELNYYKK